MMREQIFNDTMSRGLAALLLFGLLSGDRACPRERGHDTQNAVQTLDVRGVRFEFIRIPAGEFVMGCDNDDLAKPPHTVRIGYAFEMGRTEVTVAQFRAFAEATGYMTDGEKEGSGAVRLGEGDWQSQIGVDWRNTIFPQSDDDPATFISWNDAMAFCRWLSAESGREIRLPSEAEWEYACRAGTTGAYAGELNAMGWHRYNSGRRTHAVAQKQPNAWGLYDTHGNVWEWCLDVFAMNYEGAPADGSPRREADRDYGVVSRGGSFINPSGWLASAGRMASFRDCSHYNNGFRLVRVIKSEDSVRVPAERLLPVETALPRPMFQGTPPNIRAPRTKPVQKEPGPPFLAPVGTKNIALGKPVSSSDAEPITGDLEMVTDGDKEAADGSYVELGPLLQHVTIDLETEHEIYGVRVWHYHKQPRVYFDVIVQISNDPDFIEGVKTIFNNDMDNSAGLGVGEGLHYVDTSFGEIFDARGLPGRYVRLYSNGNTTTDTNHYIEVEIYGKPVDQTPKLTPLNIHYPRPMFISHRSSDFMDRVANVEKPPSEAPPPLMVPPGTRNVALDKPVTHSGNDPIVGCVHMITDGQKEIEPFVEWEPGLSHVTIDLEEPHVIHAIAFWHYHTAPRIYFDVIVQISNDPEFRTGVTAVFNNDHDNSAGMGVGRDKHYVDTCWGKVIPVDGVRGRYVRLHSNGNDQNELNQYLEVEVYGRPADL